MALPALASTDDLTANGVDFDDDTQAEHLLDVASAVVRAAAGSPILSADSIVELVGYRDMLWLNLPGQPVTAVDGVDIDGTETTDYRLRSGRLWRACGWSSDCGPSAVTVTMTHGLAEVPADIVYLVCALVGAGLAAAASGLASADPSVVAEMDGDYQVTFVRGAEAVASAMDLPRAARLRLRTRFGGGAGMVTYR